MKKITKKIYTTEELDKRQKEIATEISKELGGCDVNCINLGTSDKREFEVPVTYFDGVTRTASIEFEYDIESASAYNQVLESHFNSVARAIREEKTSENSKNSNSLMED